MADGKLPLLATSVILPSKRQDETRVEPRVMIFHT
ncbi:hypothetical protein J2S21_003218 [Peribacillus cavernae]|nr:hypothetical protein [Peribacillus cavernae]